jgi:hypothetical protein
MSVSINGTTGLVFNDGSAQTTAASGFGFKNRIINGDMRIDQRNAGASVAAANGAYQIDRWRTELSGGGAYTVQQSTTAPVGFTNSALITVTTADSSIASTDYYDFQQFIEGFNVADLGWGTANAQAVTLSFGVRSSVTGTFAGSLMNSASNRAYVFTYTVNAANTFEYKTVTIPGDTTGTWLTNNGRGITLSFDLGNGSSYQAAAGSWVGQYAIGTSTSVKLIATNGATFYITGVQLEKGSTATSFDYRPYGTEEALCETYFQSIGGDAAFERLADGVVRSSTIAGASIWLKRRMRTVPTITFSSAGHFATWSGNTSNTVTAIASDNSSRNVVNLDFTVSSGLFTNAAIQIIANNSTSARLFFSSEL